MKVSLQLQNIRFFYKADPDKRLTQGFPPLLKILYFFSFD